MREELIHEVEVAILKVRSLVQQLTEEEKTHMTHNSEPYFKLVNTIREWYKV